MLSDVHPEKQPSWKLVCRSFDPANKQQVLNSAQEWANAQNAESQKTPMQNALQNAGKAFNAHNAQIEAQKADPNATPESVTAGAVRHMPSNPTKNNPGLHACITITSGLLLLLLMTTWISCFTGPHIESSIPGAGP
jgi:hypothetical protein